MELTLLQVTREDRRWEEESGKDLLKRYITPLASISRSTVNHNFIISGYFADMN